MTAPALESLQIPTCEKGLGRIILTPDDRHIIQDVHIEACSLWPDDRGYFMEVLRNGQGLAASYPLESTQVSAALSYPGTIKAFHYHRVQTDLWTPVVGMLQVALVDLRPDSPTCGVKNTIYVGMLRPWRILIPPGVAHGYKVIGEQPAVLVYATSRFYDPSDEGRIRWNHELIGYDWETQHK